MQIISEHTFRIIVLSWIALGILLFPILVKITVPYGRHSNKKWGPVLDNQLGWIIMELPSPLFFTLLVFTGGNKIGWPAIGFVFLWLVHYANRIFIFPQLIHTKGKKMPLLIVVLGIFFNCMNSGINGYWIGYLSPVYMPDWLLDPRFIVGIIVFISGFIINQNSDHYLISLRKGGKKGYFIPQGKLFRKISCPNFLGEIIEWTGFAIMTWSLPGISFAVWTAANLIPRAIHHHKWYKDTFPDYPTRRKAIFPWIL